MNNKNQDSTEDYIIMSKESMLEKLKVETEKVNKVLQYIPTDNITELSELIYTGVKLVCNKIGILLRNPNRNTNPGWKINLEGQIKKLWERAKLLRKVKHKNPTEKKRQQTSLTIQLEKINQKIFKKEEDYKGSGTGSNNINRTGHSKITNENSINRLRRVRKDKSETRRQRRNNFGSEIWKKKEYNRNAE